MFLTDEEIANAVANEHIIENFDSNKLGSISYDLEIEKIVIPEDGNHKELNSYLLEPGSTVFISSKENINLPNNLMCFVNPRNSCIRMGLNISAPIYQPGHHTKIFIRVSNSSGDRVMLRAGESIASIMFSRLSKDVASPYQGPFTDEFSYTGLGSFHTTKTPNIY